MSNVENDIKHSLILMSFFDLVKDTMNGLPIDKMTPYQIEKHMCLSVVKNAEELKKGLKENG